MAHRSVAELKVTVGAGPPLGPEIARFYYPLALTTILNLGLLPIVTFFMGHAPRRWSRWRCCRWSAPWSSSSARSAWRTRRSSVALIGDGFEGLPAAAPVRGPLGVAVTLGLGVIAWTPLSQVWFERVSGLSPELAQFAVTPTRVLVFIPALTVLLSFQRAVLVNSRATGHVTWATVIEVGVVVGILCLGIFGLQHGGAGGRSRRPGGRTSLRQPLPGGAAAPPAVRSRVIRGVLRPPDRRRDARPGSTRRRGLWLNRRGTRGVTMEYRALGKSGLQVSALSFGAWVTFGTQVERRRGRACMDAAVRGGRELLRQRRGLRRRQGRDGHGRGDQARSAGGAATWWSRPRSSGAASGPNDRGLSRKHVIEGTRRGAGAAAARLRRPGLLPPPRPRTRRSRRPCGR